MQDYYPWKIRILRKWLDQEKAKYPETRSFSNALGIQSHTIRDWSVQPLPTITLDQLQRIAKYRKWSLQQTFEWLELKQAHIEFILQTANK